LANKKGKEEAAAPIDGAAVGAVEAPKAPYPIFDFLGANVPGFEDYFNAHLGTIREIQAVLSKSLSDDPMIMYSQVREAESKLGTIKSILAFANSYLDVGENAALGLLHDRSGSYTDLDRRTAVAAAVARQRRFRDVCLGIMESIETRVSLGQSGLRFIERNQG